VLNAGFQSGPFATIPRCIGNNHDVEDFDTFCPKIIAGHREEHSRHGSRQVR
jgi:hypothetical protein